MLLQKSDQSLKRPPRKLTPHPLLTAPQSLQLRKLLSRLMERAKVQSHRMQHQNLPTHLHNQRIHLLNLPTPHQDLPTPPQSPPIPLQNPLTPPQSPLISPLQNPPTPCHRPPPLTRPLRRPTPPHSHSPTVPNLHTLPHAHLTAQRHPTPMRLPQSMTPHRIVKVENIWRQISLLTGMSSTTTCQTALPLTEGCPPPSLAPGRNAAATRPRLTSCR